MQDGIIAFLLWGSAEQLPFSGLSAEFKTFWDDIGGLLLGLAAGYIFEVFENSEFIINRLVQWSRRGLIMVYYGFIKNEYLSKAIYFLG